tara:strand:- start:1016 stop:1951 length:936 start_codon:yes stop_codon:yes gene_type:complete
MQYFLAPFFILLSIGIGHITITDDYIYDARYDKLYSEDEFINSLICDSNFSDNKYFLKYKKSHDNLKLSESWFVYLVSTGLVLEGIDGILNPEKWEEGGSEYDLNNPDRSAPGFGNIFAGVLFYGSYFGYNKIKKERARIHVINQYNSIYSTQNIEPLEISDDFWSSGWGLSTSFGVSTDKASVGLGNVSISKYLNEKSEVYGAFGSLIFTINLGAGYTHYFDSRYKSSNFLGTSINLMLAGDGNGGYSNRSAKVYFGRSFKVPRPLFKNKNEWGCLNFGLVVDYSSNPISNDINHLTLMPLLTLEARRAF